MKCPIFRMQNPIKYKRRFASWSQTHLFIQAYSLGYFLFEVRTKSILRDFRTHFSGLRSSIWNLDFIRTSMPVTVTQNLNNSYWNGLRVRKKLWFGDSCDDVKLKSHSGSSESSFAIEWCRNPICQGSRMRETLKSFSSGSRSPTSNLDGKNSTLEYWQPSQFCLRKSSKPSVSFLVNQRLIISKVRSNIITFGEKLPHPDVIRVRESHPTVEVELSAFP